MNLSWLPCVLILTLLSASNAVLTHTLQEHYPPEIMTAVFDAFGFNERGTRKQDTDVIRSRFQLNELSPKTQELLRRAERPCTPYNCTDEPKVPPINLCIIIQKSCTVKSSDVKLAYNHARAIIKTINNADVISTVIYSAEGEVQDKLRRTKGAKIKKIRKILKKFRPPSTKKQICEDCKANTKDAIHKCWDEFDKHGANNTLQDVIIIYTDGVSFDTRFNLVEERQRTLDKVESTKLRTSPVVSYVFKYDNPSGPVNGDIEWNALNIPSDVANMHQGVPMSLTKASDGVKFVSEMCKGVPDCTPKPPSCGQIDLVLIVDRSNSITIPNIKRTKLFLRNLVSHLQISEGNVRIGLISYNQNVTVHASIGAKLNKTQVLSKIAAIPNRNALATHTHEAIFEARQMLLASQRRRLAKQIMIIATDGQTWLLKDNAGGYAARHNSPLTVNQSRLAKKEGVELYFLGLPNRGGKKNGIDEEWIPSSSEPFECHFVDMTDPGVTFDDLVFARFHLLVQLCLANGECRYAEEDTDEATTTVGS
ncbi:unnamed protein product [Owenia fusiformis]|uniref:Uncharacterized protein n=1 Tax=Owenia fusiformis TaxID=6347 RepID=A0A8J1TX31_OWEFU|nr:unnamed protein product [Owenia fusiformis]